MGHRRDCASAGHRRVAFDWRRADRRRYPAMDGRRALADGSSVVVERSARIERSHIVKLDASMKFTGELAHLAELRTRVAPLVLYLHENIGEWVIVATTSSCEVLQARGPSRFWFAADKPPTKYFEFRWRNARWVQTPLFARAIGRQANLFTWIEKAETSHLTIAAKERQKARVGELLAGTRFVYLGFRTNTEWQPDIDPTTVQAVSISAQRSSGASDDGQVLYLNADAGGSFKESYSRRLSAAGLAQFAQ